jgi:hypothetical protein
MSFESIDQDLQVLTQNKKKWAQLSLKQKLKYLEDVLVGIEAVAEAQVQAGAEAKGLAPNAVQVGEEWLGGPIVQARITRQLLEALQCFEQKGHTGIQAQHAHSKPWGQVAVNVYPHSLLDKISLQGFEAELWLDPQESLDSWHQKTAAYHRNPTHDGCLSLVLGAGNVASIGLLDALDKLFVNSQVCYLKFNPVNEYLFPFYAEIFKSLIDAGYFRMIKGGVDVGEYLCQHELIEDIHITGSDRTHDAIVYGTGEGAAERKAKDEKVCDKTITSELGNVSPVIIVPGSWTAKEIQFHAENIASQMTNNAGFNCNAARVLILQKDWPQRRQFLDALQQVLAQIPLRSAYYPGAHQRYQTFMQSHDNTKAVEGPESKIYGNAPATQPWGLVLDIDPKDRDHTCFTQESFCALSAQTSLSTSDAAEFLQQATDFANQTLWGTLNACIIIDPRTQKEYQKELDQAVRELKYGSVCINHWPALSYAMGVTAWGAYPGHHAQDIQSGIGFVHNSFMISNVQKTVIQGPFVIKPRPPWFVTHKNVTQLGPALLHLEMKPSLWRLPPVLWHAIRG